LKIIRCAASTLLMFAGSVPLAIWALITAACERNPSLGSLEKIFVSPAVMVTITSHVIGMSVTNA